MTILLALSGAALGVVTFLVWPIIAVGLFAEYLGGEFDVFRNSAFISMAFTAEIVWLVGLNALINHVVKK